LFSFSKLSISLLFINISFTAGFTAYKLSNSLSNALSLLIGSPFVPIL